MAKMSSMTAKLRQSLLFFMDFQIRPDGIRSMLFFMDFQIRPDGIRSMLFFMDFQIRTLHSPARKVPGRILMTDISMEITNVETLWR